MTTQRQFSSEHTLLTLIWHYLSVHMYNEKLPFTHLLVYGPSKRITSNTPRMFSCILRQ